MPQNPGHTSRQGLSRAGVALLPGVELLGHPCAVTGDCWDFLMQTPVGVSASSQMLWWPLSSASSPLLPPWNQPLLLCRPAQAADPMGNPSRKKPQKSVFSWISSLSHGIAHCQDKGWGRTRPGAWQQQQTSQVLLYWEQGISPE